MSGTLGRFPILLQAANNSSNPDEQLDCISRILSLDSSELEASDLYVSFCKKMLRSSTPRLRKDTLYLISKLWSNISPTSVEIFTHYTKDDDPSVRATAIQALSNKVSSDYFKLFFQDDSDIVQICAMTSFYESSRQIGNDDAIFSSLANQAFSSFHSVTLHSIKLLGQLSPSLRNILESLNHDPKVPKSAFMLWLLESEYCEIRMAVLDALESLTLRFLSQNSFENIGSLIWRIVKLMLDAINDEFEEVRLKVFTFLQKLTPYFTLKRKVDIDSCIFKLNDTDINLRRAIYEFLSKVKIENPNHALIIIETLQNMFPKFPEDQDDIYFVCSHFGRNNSRHGAFLMNKLLVGDKRFLSSECDWNDNVYVSKLLLLVNASAYSRKFDVPEVFHKHMNYISDLYPTYVPPLPNSSLSSIVLTHNIEESELNTHCLNLLKTINTILSNPHCYIHNSDLSIPHLLYETCILQHSYKVSYNQNLLPVYQDFIMDCRTACHTVLLLSMLGSVATGRHYEEKVITAQVESLWKAANAINRDNLLEYCANVSKEQLDSRDSKEIWYRKLLKCIYPVRFEAACHTKAQRRYADITYPTGDVAVSECDLLSIRGVGDSDLHCIIQYPDGTLESAACEMFGQHMSAYIRVHKPIGMVNVSACIAVVYNTSDVRNGQGLNEAYWKCKSFVPISAKVEIVIKQKVS